MKFLDKEKFKKWLQDPRNRLLVISIACMLLIILGVQFFSAPEKTEDTPEETADTYIPDGYVLVPIELQNADSLSS
ncbi:MAG: hypothetical protein ACAH59_07505, partial [Pseudobdellovibrionaceae bacterium]